MRAADSANDNKFWDGQTSSSNMLVADEKADCKVCSSGQYQHQTQQTTCIDCPAGTARATHDNDDDPWDGGQIMILQMRKPIAKFVHLVLPKPNWNNCM